MMIEININANSKIVIGAALNQLLHYILEAYHNYKETLS